MSNIPEGLHYSESHEWVKVVEGKTVLIGITDFAQAQLGSVVFVELPEVGSALARQEAFGAVESVKAASDLYSPVTGTVLEVNEALVQSPEAVNADPYGAWMVKAEVSSLSELEGLLDKAAYAKICH